MNQNSCTLSLRLAMRVAFAFSFTYALCGTPNAPSLEWDPNPEPSIGGYNVYSGEASRYYSRYTRVIDVGSQTSLLLTNLNAGVTYFFAVTAYDAGRVESPFSDEISYTPRVDGESATVLPCTFSFSRETQTIRFSGHPGQQCRVVASSNLREWEQIYFIALTDSAFVEYTETVADVKPIRFYRVVASPP